MTSIDGFYRASSALHAKSNRSAVSLPNNLNNKKRPMRACAVIALCVCLVHLRPVTADAQNWSFDARNIGMGGVGSTSNVAVDMVDEQRPYRAIVLPFGLFQVLAEPAQARSHEATSSISCARSSTAASPIHYIVGRDDTSTASAFITDLRNGELNRDLNVYRGFSPATSVSAEGLASPNWGHTFKFQNRRQRPVSGHLRRRAGSTSR